MRYRLIGIILVILLSFAALPAAHAQDAVYLIRHAEQVLDVEDPPLTDVGQQRAQAWAGILRDAGIKVVYTLTFADFPLATQSSPAQLPPADTANSTSAVKMGQIMRADSRLMFYLLTFGPAFPTISPEQVSGASCETAASLRIAETQDKRVAFGLGHNDEQVAVVVPLDRNVL